MHCDNATVARDDAPISDFRSIDPGLQNLGLYIVLIFLKDECRAVTKRWSDPYREAKFSDCLARFDRSQSRRSNVSTVVVENVYFMLQLDRGNAMRWLVEQFEALQYKWAYRVIDTMSFGLPQRRRRVYMVASRTI